MKNKSVSRIHWLCWQPTPYNDFLFENLAQNCDIDLVVHYRVAMLKSHPWKSVSEKKYCSRTYKTFLGIDWHVLGLFLKEPKAFFICAGWDHPTSILLLVALRLTKKKYALWTDVPNLCKRPFFRGHARALLLKWFFSGAKGLMGTGIPGLEILRLMGGKEKQLINFPYWINLNAYTRCLIPFNLYAIQQKRVINIVSSGRIKNSLKGHDIAIKALAKVANYIGIKFNYRIAGTGIDEANLINLAAKLGLSDKLVCLGWLEADANAQLLREADILIHPSPIHEPYGNAIQEGMAASLVVFASDVCGAALDRIEHGINGFIHQAGNIDQLADQLLWLFKNPDQISKISQCARKTAEQWPIERAVNTIRNLVKSV